MELYLDGVLQPEVLEVFRDLQQALTVKPFVEGQFALLEIDARHVAPSDSLSGGGGGGGALDDLTINGFSLHYNESVNLVGISNILNYVFQMGYKPPTVTFTANGVGSVYEKGQSVNVNLLTTNVTKESNPIASVKFYKNGIEIHAAGSVSGDSQVFTFNPSETITNTTTFGTSVTDAVQGGTGGNTVNRTVTYNFVYPYYTGWDNAGLTAVQVKALSKMVIASNSSVTVDYVVNTSAKVFYFAYPKSYGALISILDKNGYEVLSDFTQRDEPITGLDGTPQNYYIYEFKNPVVPNDYKFTYKR